MLPPNMLRRLSRSFDNAGFKSTRTGIFGKDMDIEIFADDAINEGTIISLAEHLRNDGCSVRTRKNRGQSAL
jgi:hypothetical protein